MDLVGAGTAGVIPTLIAGLCDDAALFPPANTAAAQAVPAHWGHRTAWYREMIGPFLATAADLPEVAKAARAAEVFVPLVLVVPEGPDALGPAVRATMREPGIELVGVEVAGGADRKAAVAAQRAVDALARELPEGVRGAVEVRRGEGLAETLDVLASTPFRAKFRTGGTVAAAFPTEEETAGFIAECAARRLPFKCTAGLHGAARHTDPTTGFEHHGFLNILVAASVADEGGSADAIASALRMRSAPDLADAMRRLTPEAAARTRAAFTGYGTCSIAEPLAELTALGLVTRPAPVSQQR
jgi:hypothetical protein